MPSPSTLATLVGVRNNRHMGNGLSRNARHEHTVTLRSACAKTKGADGAYGHGDFRLPARKRGVRRTTSSPAADRMVKADCAHRRRSSEVRTSSKGVT